MGTNITRQLIWCFKKESLWPGDEDYEELILKHVDVLDELEEQEGKLIYYIHSLES